MSEKLKVSPSISDQIRMLGRLAYALNNSPRNTMDTIVHHFDLNSTQYRIFLAAYTKAGDDPLEV